MLRSLLADRFQLRVHNEEMLFSVYILQAAKKGARLSPPDPKSHYRTGCFNNAPIVCHNVTMGMLAGALQSNGTEIDIPVVDETGMEGRYDLSLTPGFDSAAGETVTIFDALARVGLRLDRAKRPMTVFVIDHVEPLRPEK